MIQQLENFPELAKAGRKQRVLSQEELAHALDVSFATVNRWENSKTAPSRLAGRLFVSFCRKYADGIVKKITGLGAHG
ncbi:MAG: helix-turn-helix transcriptional regulator [Desulfobacterales bacterium]|nr:helix-turn-helix transcriptional regulator [Desulfobacterales bacterium]MDD4072790.1 helix-turn-helix transcriptional regulator [Desulfobacterales bacterium]MDD4392087.1 helix-turn-helix transcriptional regulator [Desulfobacterales bacterium]